MTHHICAECGTANADTARFCFGCGKPLHREATVAPPAPRPTDAATTGAAIAASGPRPERVPQPPARRGERLTTIVALCVAVALSGIALVVWFATRRDPEPERRTTQERAAAAPRTEPSAAEDGTTSSEPSPARVSSSNPSPSTAPRATTTAPPLLPVAEGDDATAMQAVQELASALAEHRWDDVRTHPAYSDVSDAQLEENYGGLNRSTAFFVTSTPSGADLRDMRAAFLAWEDVGAGRRTNVYCMTWQVDLRQGKVVSTARANFVRATPESVPDYRDIDEFADLIRAQC